MGIVFKVFKNCLKKWKLWYSRWMRVLKYKEYRFKFHLHHLLATCLGQITQIFWTIVSGKWITYKNFYLHPPGQQVWNSCRLISKTSSLIYVLFLGDLNHAYDFNCYFCKVTSEMSVFDTSLSSDLLICLMTYLIIPLGCYLSLSPVQHRLLQGFSITRYDFSIHAIPQAKTFGIIFDCFFSMSPTFNQSATLPSLPPCIYWNVQFSHLLECHTITSYYHFSPVASSKLTSLYAPLPTFSNPFSS